MKGKVLQFKGSIDSFKTKDDEVTIQFKASTKDVSLDRLNEFTKDSIGINLESAQTELIPESNDNDIPN